MTEIPEVSFHRMLGFVRVWELSWCDWTGGPTSCLLLDGFKCVVVL